MRERLASLVMQDLCQVEPQGAPRGEQSGERKHCPKDAERSGIAERVKVIDSEQGFAEYF